MHRVKRSDQDHERSTSTHHSSSVYPKAWLSNFGRELDILATLGGLRTQAYSFGCAGAEVLPRRLSGDCRPDLPDWEAAVQAMRPRWQSAKPPDISDWHVDRIAMQCRHW